jgi:hypothetical protein
LSALSAVCRDVPVDMQSLLKDILKRLAQTGLQNAIVVDLADNDIFSVVFVCVPGLEYKSSKARALYTPGSRMRDFISQCDPPHIGLATK